MKRTIALAALLGAALALPAWAQTKWDLPTAYPANNTLAVAAAIWAGREASSDAVGLWTLIFAWAYVAGRLVQSAIHMTYNNPAHRGIGFILGALAMIALWVNLGMAIVGKL